MRQRIFYLLVMLFCLTSPAAKAQVGNAEPHPALSAYEKHLFITESNDTLPYRLLTPEHPTKGQRYPLVLFLHGAGERGNDNAKQLTHGAQMWLNPVNRSERPCFVLAPQCPLSGYWAYNERPTSFVPEEMPLAKEPSRIYPLLKALLMSYAGRPDVDPNRIYVIGLSMGGMATYDIVVRNPQLFAAAIPICGTINPSRLEALKGSPTAFRLFHGDADPVVTVEGSRQAYRQLKAVGVRIDYHEFPGCTHGSWNPAFGCDDFMSWLFSQQKR